MKSLAFGILSLAVALLNAGCATSKCIMHVYDAVPAYRLPCEFHKCSREGTIPIDLSLLSQQRPKEGHRLGKGDLIGVYVAGVLPPKIDDQPLLYQQLSMTPTYYPPYGRVLTPNMGIPVDVASDGTVRLPLVGKLNLNDQTIEEATDTIRKAYEKKNVIQEDRERVLISLLRPRVKRVVVMREDAQAPVPQTIQKMTVPYTKLGRGEVVDLPAYENDVLHALASTGGLPGIDVFSEVWIFRSRMIDTPDAAAVSQQIEAAGSPEALAKKWEQQERQVVRIPLRVFPNDPVPFTEDDITLEDGDVIYLPPREVEVIYTGGQLPSGKVPLPRDVETDVLEAIALVNGSAGGPSVNGSIFRTGPGNVVPPTDVLIVRKLPNGQQLRIRVDLNRALHDPNERILMQPEDQILLFYKPGELYTNIFLNFIGVGVNLVPKI